MKIGSRFWLAAVTAVALVVAVSLVLYASSRRFSAAEAKREEITELLQQINSLSHLTIDYLLQPSPGVKQQWLGVQEDLTASLGRRPFTEPERVAVVAGIRERVERMGSLFEDLAASSGASGAANRGASELQREKRRVIGSFLQIAMHETAADILYLHALADGDVNRAQAYARSMILVLVFTAGLVVCGVVFTLHRSVVGPLAALHRGVAAVSAGDLGFRTCSLTRDEIGDLARSFDAMLDELQKRSGELSAANAELRLHRNHLERLVEERTQEVRMVSDHLAAAQAMAHLGSWQWDAAQDQITGSAEFYRLFGVQPERLVTYADFNALLHPDDREHVRLAVEEAFARKALYQTEYRVPHPDGGCSQIQARGELTVDEQGRPRTMVGTCLDITERKQGEEALRRANTDLARSNLELEQFAYVASHDLQEPLRMVASYTQLLAQRYEGQLDEKARKYIDYAVDGAVRMQGLINDLLDFSRIGTRGKPPEPTAARDVLAEALHNLEAAITTSRAIVTADELPTLRADAAQLALVFQNLIGNAVKFHGEREPRVHVGVAEVGDEWIFSVKDNGIGIEAQYAERIFVIFQRLHTREEYPGTGIGLAVCKRIVERHGGRIWFESEPGQGSTFFFSIPK